MGYRPPRKAFFYAGGDARKLMSPNIIGFQSVMMGVARRLLKQKTKAAKMVVDQQSEFNGAQKTLADYYNRAKGLKAPMGPGMPIADFTGMPNIPLTISSSNDSAGLELVDMLIWIFKRLLEQKEVAPELLALVYPMMNQTYTDELSLRAIEKRWIPWFESLPELENLPEEQLTRAAEIHALEERRRLESLADIMALEAQKSNN